MASLPCPLYIYHFGSTISWQLPGFLRVNLVFCFYIRARERSVWKIRCEFALLCSGKSVNLKLAHKIKLSWINLQHSPLGDILNDVLLKAFLLFPGLAVLLLTESFDQKAFYCLTQILPLSLRWITAFFYHSPSFALMNCSQSFWRMRHFKNQGHSSWTLK